MSYFFTSSMTAEVSTSSKAFEMDWLVLHPQLVAHLLVILLTLDLQTPMAWGSVSFGHQQHTQNNLSKGEPACLYINASFWQLSPPHNP